MTLLERQSVLGGGAVEQPPKPESSVIDDALEVVYLPCRDLTAAETHLEKVHRAVQLLGKVADAGSRHAASLGSEAGKRYANIINPGRMRQTMRP